MPNETTEDVIYECREDQVVQFMSNNYAKRNSVTSSDTSLSEETDSDKSDGEKPRCENDVTCVDKSPPKPKNGSSSTSPPVIDPLKCSVEAVLQPSMAQLTITKNSCDAEASQSEKYSQKDDFEISTQDLTHVIDSIDQPEKKVCGEKGLPPPNRRDQVHENIHGVARSSPDKGEQQQPRKRGRPRNSGPADRSGKGFREIRPRVVGRINPRRLLVKDSEIKVLVGAVEAKISKNNALHVCAYEGNIEQFNAYAKNLIMDGDSKAISDGNSIQQTALFIFILKGNEQGMLMALAVGVDPNRQGRFLTYNNDMKKSLLTTPLSMAVKSRNLRLLTTFLSQTKDTLHLDQCGESSPKKPNSGLNAIGDIVVWEQKDLLPQLETLVQFGAKPFHEFATSTHPAVTAMALALMHPRRVDFAVTMIETLRKTKGAMVLTELRNRVSVTHPNFGLLTMTHLELAKLGIQHCDDQAAVGRMNTFILKIENELGNPSKFPVHTAFNDEIRRQMTAAPYKSPALDIGSEPSSPDMSSCCSLELSPPTMDELLSQNSPPNSRSYYDARYMNNFHSQEYYQPRVDNHSTLRRSPQSYDTPQMPPPSFQQQQIIMPEKHANIQSPAANNSTFLPQTPRQQNAPAIPVNLNGQQIVCNMDGLDKSPEGRELMKVMESVEGVDRSHEVEHRIIDSRFGETSFTQDQEHVLFTK